MYEIAFTMEELKALKADLLKLSQNALAPDFLRKDLAKQIRGIYDSIEDKQIYGDFLYKRNT